MTKNLRCIKMTFYDQFFSDTKNLEVSVKWALEFICAPPLLQPSW